MPGAAEQCAVAHVVAVLASHLADEVEDGEDPLPLCPSESAAELLEEDGRALGRTEHEDGVDLGEVHPLVEEVYGEDHAELPAPEPAKRLGALRPRGPRIKRDGGVAETGELPRHEVRVLDAGAEPEGPHPVRIRHVFLDRLADPERPHMVTGEHLVELARHVASAREPDAGEVRGVVHPEVVEGAEEPLVEGVPEPRLVRDTVVEPTEHGPAVRTLGSGREPEEDFRGEAPEEAVVACRRRVVELVHDDDVEGIRSELVHTVGERLHGGEDVAAGRRTLPADEALPEGRLAEDELEDLLALTEDLVPVGDEEE